MDPWARNAVEDRKTEDHPLNEVDQTTVYTDGAAGYTDCPVLEPVAS